LENIELIRVEMEDAKSLRDSQVKTFKDDNKNKSEGKAMGFPPGCDSIKWNSDRILENEVYKITCDGMLVGGFIIFTYGKNKKEIGRVWIEPEYQNKGIGKKAFDILFKTVQSKTEWKLETPDWAVRNHHFYEKVGFKKIGETEFNKFCGWKEYKYVIVR
jgi:RimJ/RimL family protein N-acetyltransferase